MPLERLVETDVLVIGGGMAGLFAAIKAKEQGVDVTLTDKAFVGKAGATHYAEGDLLYFRPERGHKLDEWLSVLSLRSEYVNNREWDEICLKESKERYDDLVAWGVRFYEKDGEPYIFSGTGGTAYKTEDVTMLTRKYAPTIRQKALESKIRILDRVMIGDLLKQDGCVMGAVGFHTISGDLYVIKARATVIATGSSSLKSGNYPNDFWTGDGEAMAYRAGAEIVSKEFMYGMHYYRADVERQRQAWDGTGLSGPIDESAYRFPRAIGGDFSGWFNRPTVTAEGSPVVLPAWEAHCGRAPLYLDFGSYGPAQQEWLKEYLKRIGTAQADKIGLDILRGQKIKWPSARMNTNSLYAGSGIVPVDTGCASGVPGLYAAGNSCGTMTSGAMYAGMGVSLNHAAVTGARAGMSAARYAAGLKTLSIDQTTAEAAKRTVTSPIERKGGFSPDWVTLVLQGMTIPYFILNVKHAERMEAALTLVRFVKSHLVPKLMAGDSHEWRMAHETANMVLIAEMRLMASLFRTESRGNHFREDYPRRDDPNWLAWVKLKEAQGEMRVWKEPIPEKWWPDLTKPYEERYPRMLPME